LAVFFGSMQWRTWLYFLGPVTVFLGPVWSTQLYYMFFPVWKTQLYSFLALVLSTILYSFFAT
jgi:hypothetical protein